MSRCVAALRRCVLDWLLDLVRDVKHEEAWAALPQRIILIRHGQAEHNLEEGAVRLARSIRALSAASAASDAAAASRSSALAAGGSARVAEGAAVGSRPQRGSSSRSSEEKASSSAFE